MQGCARPDGALGLLHSAEAACKAALGLGEWKASGLDDEVESGVEAPKRHLKWCWCIMIQYSVSD